MEEKKNKKLVIIIISLLSIIILMTGYIAYDAIMNKNNQKIFGNDSNDISKEEIDDMYSITLEDNDPVLTSINTKYKDLNFVRTTKLECVSLNRVKGADEFSDCFKVKIENGSIVFENKNGQKFLSAGITNFKYITEFNEAIHDFDSKIAALTTSGNLYIPVMLSEKDKKVYFEKVNYSKKIHELYVSQESDGIYMGELYVLDQEDELLGTVVQCNENNYCYYSIEGKYEKREIFFGGSSGRDYRGTVSLINKTATLDEDIINFNGQVLKLKYLFKTYYDNVIGLYLVTEDDKIYTTKKNIDMNNCGDTCHDDAWYQIVLYKNLEVESVFYNKDIVTVAYKNGTIEKIKDMTVLIDLEKAYYYNPSD